MKAATNVRLKAEEAEAVILRERENRSKACGDEINEVLKKHNCVLDVAVIIGAQGNRPILNVVAN